MLSADTRRELYPAEERLCFIAKTGFLSQEHSLCCWAGNIHGHCVGLALAASCTSDPAPRCGHLSVGLGDRTRNVLLVERWLRIKNVHS